MWLEVGPSNNDPEIVACNFVQTIASLKGMTHQLNPGIHFQWWNISPTSIILSDKYVDCSDNYPHHYLLHIFSF